MATTDRLKDALTKFLASDQPGVFALKGAWGVGKTFFWHQFAKGAKPAKNCRAYSYVSLFGISTVAELRRAIFARQTPLGAENKTVMAAAAKYSTTLLRNVKLSVGPIENTEAWAEIVEDKSLKNFLVCIDDLERMENDLSPSALLGFIGSLRDERQCKVVLLYNDDEIVKDSELEKKLAAYREKVIDRELTYQPTVVDSYQIAFGPTAYRFRPAKHGRVDPFNPTDERSLLEIFQSIETANIRVMRKAHDALEYFEDGIAAKYPLQWPHVARQVVKVCCLHYIYARQFSVDEVVNQDKWIAIYMAKDDKDKEERMAKYKPAKTIGYFASEADALILEFLRLGYVDWPAREAKLVAEEKRLKMGQLGLKFRANWDLIWANFQADQATFNTDMAEFIRRHSSKMGLSEISQAVEVLREFGGATPEIEQLLTSKIDTLVAAASSASDIDMEMHGIPGQVIEQVRAKLNARKITKPIPDVVALMTKEGGWNPSDLEFIAHYTEEDFYQFAKSSKERDFLRRLRTFRERLGAEHHGPEIRVRLEAALTKLGRESAINARRVRFGIGFDFPPEDPKK